MGWQIPGYGYLETEDSWQLPGFGFFVPEQQEQGLIAPTLTAPANAATGVALRPNFTWS